MATLKVGVPRTSFSGLLTTCGYMTPSIPPTRLNVYRANGRQSASVRYPLSQAPEPSTSATPTIACPRPGWGNPMRPGAKASPHATRAIAPSRNQAPTQNAGCAPAAPGSKTMAEVWLNRSIAATCTATHATREDGEAAVPWTEEPLASRQPFKRSITTETVTAKRRNCGEWATRRSHIEGAWSRTRESNRMVRYTSSATSNAIRPSWATRKVRSKQSPYPRPTRWVPTSSPAKVRFVLVVSSSLSTFMARGQALQVARRQTLVAGWKGLQCRACSSNRSC